MKFRAWDTLSKRWRDEFDWVVNPETGNPHWIHDNDFYQGEANQLVLCRATGFFGIDGREIYEGDIIGGQAYMVRLDGTRVKGSEHQTAPKQVIWMGDGFGYSEKLDWLKHVSKTKGVEIAAKYYSVIGNVFENPDLITTPT